MASQKTLLYYGALLHDVGKVISRGINKGGEHAKLGADLISQEVAAHNDRFAGIEGRQIAEQVRYHRFADIAVAPDLPDDSLAYITCFASSIASGMDFEEESSYLEGAAGYSPKLRKIFNNLNGHHDDGVIEHESYETITQKLKDGLARIGVNSVEVGSLLALLESTVGTVPASTNPSGLIDVSLYDYAKIAAGLAACIYDFLQERGVQNYREAFSNQRSEDLRAEPMFLLFSCDMSGIQDFIYNISGAGALKQLRARSMYLELLLEHIVDELLEKLGLCRANLLYTGGGHAYLILPNTSTSVATLQAFTEELKSWFAQQYKIDLYVACSWVACSADDLANRGEDKSRYASIYQSLSRRLSEDKARRYSASTIRMLNYGLEERFDHGRECSECHRSDMHINKDGKCSLCAALGAISKSLVSKDVFVVERVGDKCAKRDYYLDLPFGCQLRMCTYEEYHARQHEAYRAYVKGDLNTSDNLATHIWMGDYTAETPEGVGLSAYAKQSATLLSNRGIQRLGVLRADVDDLGATFVAGLPDDKVSLVRTSTLSRSLSYFFKSEINRILEKRSYQAQIIYSGGDDLFIVGNWSDVLYAAIDIRTALQEYVGNGSLTISAGIGMFGDTYPIARMATETGVLEDQAKSYRAAGASKAKDAIALWSGENIYCWNEFVEGVVPLLSELDGTLQDGEKGNAFVYRLIDLLRSYDVVASAPRLAYLLARSFDDDKERGGEISRRLYALAQNQEDRKRLVTALEWHVYSVRKWSE